MKCNVSVEHKSVETRCEMFVAQLSYGNQGNSSKDKCEKTDNSGCKEGYI